jgi:hypothetical protein
MQHGAEEMEVRVLNVVIGVMLLTAKIVTFLHELSTRNCPALIAVVTFESVERISKWFSLTLMPSQ